MYFLAQKQPFNFFTKEPKVLFKYKIIFKRPRFQAGLFLLLPKEWTEKTKHRVKAPVCAEWKEVKNGSSI